MDSLRSKEKKLFQNEWPDDELEHVEVCPVCGSKPRQLLYENLMDHVFNTSPGVWKLYRCVSCGSAYLDPRPSQESIGQAYDNYYTHTKINPIDMNSVMKLPLGKMRLALRNGYLNSYYGYHLQPAHPIGLLIAYLFPISKLQEDRLIRHLHFDSQKNHLLDIGCGNGSFLAQAQYLGWEVEGLDPDPIAVVSAREAGFSVQEGTLADIIFPENYFDMLTLSHVIEHLHDPNEMLFECFRILRPGGRLWIGTPNLSAPGHRMFGRHWRGLEPPRHLILFTPESLRNLIKRIGFQVAYPPKSVASAEWYFRVSDALRLGIDIPHAPPLQKHLQWKSRFADLRACLNPELSEELVLIAQKPES